MELTEQILQQIFSNNPNIGNFVNPLNKELNNNEINTLERVSCFLAQVGVESMNFTHLSENLNYSAQGLLKTFPTHFDEDLANQYQRNPEKIANRVYANRMGNGDEDSGDGFRYRGHGIIMITGKNNTQALANDLNLDLDQTIQYLQTIEGAVAAGTWFWQKNDCSNFADNNDFVGLTKRINGGTIGLQDRQNLYDQAKQILQDSGIFAS